jgi:ribosomal small subunit protein bTHX
MLANISTRKFIMGKGDRKTTKGKIFRGSHGVSSPRKKKKTGKN